MSSELEQLRGQIEAEHQSMVWALNGLATGAAQHAYIERRMGHMEIATKRLIEIIGEEPATEMVCRVFDRTPPQRG